MNEEQIEVKEYSGKIKPEFIGKAKKMFDKYKGDKAELQSRVKQNNIWYRSRYGRVINEKTNETEPATSFVFSAIENKYADAIDNFPVPNLLEREPSDTQTAKILSKIIPAQLDMSGFKKVYKDNWRRKLKYGTAVYGVFYNENKDDIDIRAIDIMNIYCDMHVKNVQDSQFLFITSAIDNDVLKDEYPKFSALFEGSATIETQSGSYEINDRTEVVDCYYKKADGALHLMKLVKGNVIDATEDTEGYENGLYNHGMYPIIFDVLYPEEDCPFGFGVVDVVKNPQLYIDKLDGIIIKNAILSGKPRWIYKETSGVNEKELTDWAREIIHASGDISDSAIRELQAKPLPEFVCAHRTEKIDELKEVVGNRDFQQGGTANGVTAATAISVLQQAGEKLSRAMIDDSYDAYKSIVVMVIELIREFYDKERVFRITNEMGQTDFASFSNAMLLKPDTEAEYGMATEGERDALGFVADGKRVEFDIKVVPQRQNPFSREANNQTILALWGQGFFLPQNADVAIIALQAMNFDGKEKIIENIQSLSEQMKAQEATTLQQTSAGQTQHPGADDDLIPLTIGNPDGSDDLTELTI